jgi:hypothetical protein
MSNELDNQVSESVFNDKISNFYQKRKYYIIGLAILIVLVPISFQIFLTLDKKNNSKELEKYSETILGKDKKIQEAELEKLLQSSNETVLLLVLNQLLEINKDSKQKSILFIDELLNANKFSKKNIKFLKIKKSLLIFDTASEVEMLNLIDLKSKDSAFRKMSFEIMHDFYISKKQNLKANDLKRLIDEN